MGLLHFRFFNEAQKNRGSLLAFGPIKSINACLNGSEGDHSGHSGHVYRIEFFLEPLMDTLASTII